MRRFLMLLLMTGTAVAQTTTYTGTIKDLSLNVVTSGQVTFTLAPPTDSTIPGVGRFMPASTSCNINADGTLSGYVSGVVSGACIVVSNTAITPGGTSYKVCIQPQFTTPGSCFFDYAVTSSKDISTIAPTLSTGPINYGISQGPIGATGPVGPTGAAGTTTATGTSGGFVVPGKFVAGGVAFQSPEFALQATQLNKASSRDYASNTYTTFTDGSCYPWAALAYQNVYISDFALHVLRRPQSTSTACIKNVLTKFMAKVSNGSTPAPSSYTGGIGGVPPVLGSIPIALLPNGLPVAYCSAWDRPCQHPTGDGWIFAPLLEAQYYALTQDASQFTADAAALDTALSAVPVDATTGIPNITKYVPGTTPLGSEWVCWAFMEKARFTGLVTNCAAWYYASSLAMAQMYGAIGNSSRQTFWNTTAAHVKTNMGTSSALWNSGLGVFNAATGQNAQPDLPGTALACHYGLATAGECSSFSTYLAANYSTLFYYGYARQSNANWGTVGYIFADGSYNATDTESQPGCYQDGFWSMANLEIAEAINLTSATVATQMLSDFTTGPDPTMEFWSVPTTSCFRMNGSTNNLESPAGMTAYASEFPYQVVESHQQLHDWVGGGSYAADTVVAGPSVQVSATVGETPLILGNRFNTAVNDLHCSTTGGIAAHNGWCWGLRNGSTALSFFSRANDDGTINTDSMTVNAASGVPNFPEVQRGKAILHSTSNLTILGQNELFDNTGEHLQDTTLPGARFVAVGSGSFLFQIAPATTSTPAWTTVATIGSDGNITSTTGFGLSTTTTTPTTGACTPVGYLPVKINGVFFHVALCP